MCTCRPDITGDLGQIMASSSVCSLVAPQTEVLACRKSRLMLITMKWEVMTALNEVKSFQIQGIRTSCFIHILLPGQSDHYISVVIAPARRQQRSQRLRAEFGARNIYCDAATGCLDYTTVRR